jgi:hypothetical protein
MLGGRKDHARFDRQLCAVRAMSTRNIFLAIMFLTPCVLLSVPSIPPWLGRTIAVFILALGSTLFFLLAGLVPKLKWVSVGSKLRRPEFDAIRPKMEQRLRLFVLILGAFVFLFGTLPVMEDVVHLCAGEKPVQITETPQSTSTLFGTWFLAQFVNFPSEKSCSLFYSMKRVRVGEEYDFLILPRSRVIVDFHDLDR